MVDFSAALPPDGLTDGTVRLRRWRMHDAAAVHDACQDPAIVRFTHVPSPYTLEDARHFLAAAIGPRPDGVALAVVDAGSDDVMGSIGLRRGPGPHVGDIGYWVAPWARGRGIATRSVKLLSRWAVGELGMARVQLMTFVDNDASQRVAERAGFTREGVLRSYLVVKERRRDAVMFSLLPASCADRRPGRSRE